MSPQSDSRRNFVKKSIVTTIALSQPTFFSGLVRATGGDGDTTGELTTEATTAPETTWVYETTFPETTGDYETTVPVTGTVEPPLETTVPVTDTTIPITQTTITPYSMLCSYPSGVNSGIRLAISLPDGAGGTSSLILAASIDTTKFQDPPSSIGYLTCSFDHSAQASIEKPVVTSAADVTAVLYFDRGLSADCDASNGDISITEVPTLTSGTKVKTFVYGGITYDLAIVLNHPAPSGGFVTTEMTVLLTKIDFDGNGDRSGFEVIKSYPEAMIGSPTPKPSVTNVFISEN